MLKSIARIQNFAALPIMLLTLKKCSDYKSTKEPDKNGILMRIEQNFYYSN